MYIKRAQGDVYVFTGSTGQAGSIGKSKVTIPTHLYKLVFDPIKNTAWAYWVENTDEAQMSPPISYAELIQKTGIDFQLPVDGSKGTSGKGSEKAVLDPPKLMGSWYPVFFDQFSPQKVAAIVSSIQSGKVVNIQIQYDRNRELAQKLVQEFQAQGFMQVSLAQSSPPESSTISYERNRVTVIVHTK